MRHFLRFAACLFLVLVSVTGCVADVPAPRAPTFATCEARATPIRRDVYLDDSFTPAEQLAVKRSFVMWSRLTAGSVAYSAAGTFPHVDLKSDPDIAYSREVKIYRVPDSSGAAKDAPRDRIGLASDSWIMLFVDRLPTENHVLAVSLHEVGHTIGLSHVDNPSAIMHDRCGDACDEPQFTVSDIAEYCRVRAKRDL